MSNRTRGKQLTKILRLISKTIVLNRSRIVMRTDINYTDMQLLGYREFCTVQVRSADPAKILHIQPGADNEVVVSVFEFQMLLEELKKIFIDRCTIVSKEFSAEGIAFLDVRQEFARIAHEALQSFTLDYRPEEYVAR